MINFFFVYDQKVNKFKYFCPLISLLMQTASAIPKGPDRVSSLIGKPVGATEVNFAIRG